MPKSLTYLLVGTAKLWYYAHYPKGVQFNKKKYCALGYKKYGLSDVAISSIVPSITQIAELRTAQSLDLWINNWHSAYKLL